MLTSKPALVVIGICLLVTVATAIAWHFTHQAPDLSNIQLPTL